jgi:hypothetical protein
MQLTCSACDSEFTVDPDDPPGRCSLCSRLYCPTCRDDLMQPMEHQPRRDPKELSFRGKQRAGTKRRMVGVMGSVAYLTEHVLEERSTTIPTADGVCDLCDTSPEPEPDAEGYLSLPIQGTEQLLTHRLRPASRSLLQARGRYVPATSKEVLPFLARKTVNQWGMTREEAQRFRKEVRLQLAITGAPTTLGRLLQSRIEQSYTPEDAPLPDALEHARWTEEVDDLAHEALMVWVDLRLCPGEEELVTHLRTQLRLYERQPNQEQLLRRLAQSFITAPTSPRISRLCVGLAYRSLYLRPARPLNIRQGVDDPNHGEDLVRDEQLVLQARLPQPEATLLLAERAWETRDPRVIELWEKTRAALSA